MNAVGWWALWILVAVVLGWQAIRAMRDEPSERDRIVAAARDRLATRPGPVTEWADVPWLQILEDAEEYVDQLAVFDPELAAGFDRLRAAAIPEQREEEDR